MCTSPSPSHGRLAYLSKARSTVFRSRPSILPSASPGTPRDVDTIEWFASPSDICAAYPRSTSKHGSLVHTRRHGAVATMTVASAWPARRGRGLVQGRVRRTASSLSVTSLVEPMARWLSSCWNCPTVRADRRRRNPEGAGRHQCRVQVGAVVRLGASARRRRTQPPRGPPVSRAARNRRGAVIPQTASTMATDPATCPARPSRQPETPVKVDLGATPRAW